MLFLGNWEVVYVINGFNVDPTETLGGIGAPDFFLGYVNDDPSLNSVYIALDDGGGPGDLGDDDYDDFVVKVTATAAPVPEPATLILLGSGLMGLAGFGRKKFIKN